MNKDNFTMLCDFYELTMANGYFKNGFYKRTTYFDVFFRNVPDNGGFAIVAGSPCFPARACPYRKGTGYRGTAYRNLYPACDKSPVAYCHKSKQNSQSGKRQNSA